MRQKCKQGFACCREIIGSFSNDNGEGNENDKNATDLISKITTLHVHNTFWKISMPSLHDYDEKMSYFTFY